MDIRKQKAVEFYKQHNKKWNVELVNGLASILGMQGFPHGPRQTTDIVSKKVIYDNRHGYHETNCYVVAIWGMATAPEFKTLRECADYILKLGINSL